MCNLYNVGAWNTTAGCRTNYGCYAGGQRMCRDCNGNVWVRITTDNCSCCGSCYYNNTCYGNNIYNTGCNSCRERGNTQNVATANGGYGCITLCGISANTTSQTTNNNATTYPTRRCGCGGGCNRCSGWNYEY